MENVKELFTDQIVLPADNMRSTIDRDELYDLADDIKKNGLINPITVRPIGDKYELVAGQRRFLAHQIGGIIRIRCIVRELTDDEALGVMTSENLARVDVNPVDEAKHIGRLMNMYNNDAQQVARVVNRSVSWVKDRVLVSAMPDYMQEELGAGRLKLGVALNLLEIDDDAILRMWTEIAVRDGTSVAMSKYWVDGYKINKLNNKVNTGTPPEGFVAGTSAPVMFECAIDGQKYDARQFRQLFIHESNLDVFSSFVEEFRNALLHSES